MSKHTPGPWTYSGDDDGDFVVWAGENFLGNVGGAPFAPVYSDPKSEMVAFDLEQANARLIAVAPEMFSLLRGFLEFHPQVTGKLHKANFENWKTSAAKLLQKVEGE